MSHVYYDEEWRKAQELLSSTLHGEIAQADRRENRKSLATLYVQYILVANRLSGNVYKLNLCWLCTFLEEVVWIMLETGVVKVARFSKKRDSRLKLFLSTIFWKVTISYFILRVRVQKLPVSIIFIRYNVVQHHGRDSPSSNATNVIITKPTCHLFSSAPSLPQ